MKAHSNKITYPQIYERYKNNIMIVWHNGSYRTQGDYLYCAEYIRRAMRAGITGIYEITTGKGIVVEKRKIWG